MPATARKNNRPLLPALITAFTVNQGVLSGVVLVREEEFWVGLLAQIVHTGILGILISASVMSWMSWHRSLVTVTVTSRPKDPTK